MKAQCCPNTSFRKIACSVHEAARDVARRIAATSEYQRSRDERKKVEMGDRVGHGPRSSGPETLLPP
jgi:hypothetical protein